MPILRKIRGFGAIIFFFSIFTTMRFVQYLQFMIKKFLYHLHYVVSRDYIVCDFFW